MNYIEFEEVGFSDNFEMPAPHSHEFYELYFLLEGKRDFFINNKMFVLGEKCLVVVPPFSIHKTEGGMYHRINVNLSPNLLSKSQTELMQKLTSKTAIKIDKEYEDIIIRLLKEGANIQKKPIENKTENLLAITNTILLFMSLESSFNSAVTISNYKPNKESAEVLKMVYYINTHFAENINLKDICEEFYLSKVSICKKFKAVMHCSVNKYIADLKLNKAKSLLRSSDKPLEEIADLCGYSSANYLSLVFKKEVGLSPLNYKKSR